MPVIIRFEDVRNPGEYTHLKTDAPSGMVVGKGGVVAKAYGPEDATVFDTPEEAWTALGKFIIERGGFKDSDWIGAPSIVDYEPEPEVIATTVVGEITLELLNTGRRYKVVVVRNGVGSPTEHVSFSGALADYTAKINIAVNKVLRGEAK